MAPHSEKIPLNFDIERKETQRVRYGCTALTHTLGRGLLGKIKITDETRITISFLNGIQAFALEILDEPECSSGSVARLDQTGRNRLDFKKLKRAPATFAGDELEFFALLTHDDRLQKSLAADALGQFTQLLGRNFTPGLIRTGRNQVNRYFDKAGRTRHHGSRR